MWGRWYFYLNEGGENESLLVVEDVNENKEVDAILMTFGCSLKCASFLEGFSLRNTCSSWWIYSWWTCI